MSECENKNDGKNYFDSVATERLHWRQKFAYYHRQLEDYFRFLIPEDSSVLEVGCLTGEFLNAVRPKRGVGIDSSAKMVKIARKNFPHLEFVSGDLKTLNISEVFDYIVLTNSLGYFEDIQEAICHLKKFCHPGTRIIVCYPNLVWKPILKIAEKINLRMKWPEKHWLSMDDVENLFRLEDLELVKKDYKFLLPLRIPFLSVLFNKILVNLPFLRHFALNFVMVFYLRSQRRNLQETTSSVIVPCRNEKGNIEQAVLRIPKMGDQTEIIFVEGHSQDGTLDECNRVKEKYPDKSIKILVQKGKGKGDAVREGFRAATGNVLMILDADLTVPPEDLPKFYNALVSGKGEFINGSRLVYKMEKHAMQFLNMIANKCFSIILTYLVGQYLKDTLCGTKVLWREDYQRIENGRHYFGDFDPFGDFDLLFGAAKLNLKIIEIPIHYRERTYGSTQIRRFRHGWILLKMTLFAMRKIKFI